MPEVIAKVFEIIVEKKRNLRVFYWLTIIFLRGSSVKTHFFFFFHLLKLRVKFGVLFDFNRKIMDFWGFFMGGCRKKF